MLSEWTGEPSEWTGEPIGPNGLTPTATAAAATAGATVGAVGEMDELGEKASLSV